MVDLVEYSIWEEKKDENRENYAKKKMKWLLYWGG